MPLVARLLLSFGFVAILVTALVGFAVRGVARDALERGFEERLETAAGGAEREVAAEARELAAALEPICGEDALVDRAFFALDRASGRVDSLEPAARAGLRRQTPEAARGAGLDELLLVAADGTVLAAVDAARVGTRDAALGAKVMAARPPGRPTPAEVVPLAPTARAGGGAPEGPRLRVHCARGSAAARAGAFGERRLEPLLRRIGGELGATLEPLETARKPAPIDAARTLEIPGVPGLRVVLAVSRAGVLARAAELDRALAMGGATALGVALVLAFLLARSLSKPIVALARETRAAAAGEPAEVTAQGGREITELTAAYNQTIAELASMRRRLAATERIAARREVARQVAHEIKNPLAPIRAATETLRRLRARDDPAFDDYFEEATATVLQEVRRIADIVTEFTEFARLPPPDPAPIDLTAVVRGVVKLHGRLPEGAGEGAPSGLVTGKSGQVVELVAEPIPEVLADKDQLIQVLTNLIQNGIEAASAVRVDPRVVVTVGPARGEGERTAPDAAPSKVRIVVRDNGPGVSEDIRPRIFEPYATSKAKGTGLGLAIASRIVYEHGGEITYRPAQKGGAVFEIVLPVAGPPLLDKAPAEITQHS